MAIVVDAGESVHGANDGVRRGSGDMFGAFENVVENAANFAVADADEVESAGMAIESANVNVKIVGGGARTAPVNEFLLDEIALGMLTDRAVRFVLVDVHTLGGSEQRMHGRSLRFAFMAGGFGIGNPFGGDVVYASLDMDAEGLLVSGPIFLGGIFGKRGNFGNRLWLDELPVTFALWLAGRFACVLSVMSRP